MLSLFDKIPVVWKAGIAIGAVFLTGFSASAVTSSVVGLPSRVDTLEAIVEDMRGLLEDVRDEVAFGNCMTLAEREGSGWRTCVRH